MYIDRAVDRLIRRAIRSKGAVLVTGARQVGKSTSLETVLPGRRYVTLDDPFLEEQAKGDSRTFMEVNPPPVTIAEVQPAPDVVKIGAVVEMDAHRHARALGKEAHDGRDGVHFAQAHFLVDLRVHQDNGGFFLLRGPDHGLQRRHVRGVERADGNALRVGVLENFL